MVAQETISMNPSTGLGADLLKGFEETAAVEVVLEDGFTSIPSAHDVINGA